MSIANRLLIQVVPRLKPGRCGISDHALALARELQVACGIDTRFVTLGESDPLDRAFAVVRSTAAGLLETCNFLNEARPGAILVHLSGYGYSPDGVPALLATALAQVNASRRFRIAVYFHELFAVGPPWKSAFWHSRRQQRAVRAIAALSDLLVTNTRYHANWLKRQLPPPGAASVSLLPVFSTVGEALAPVPTEQRGPVLPVFGLPGTRQRAYDQLSALGETLEELGIRRIIDIGPAFDCPRDVNGIPTESMGESSAAEVARLLSSSKFGFVHHSSFCLAKSSIFASYCAQGVIPLIAQSFAGEVDGLTDGVNVVSPRSAARIRKSGWEICSRAAWNWYMAHRLHVHAEQYANWMSTPA